MIYFDNSATTKPYKEVIESFVKVSTDYFGNPSSLHQLGGMAEQLLSQARNQIAKLLKVKQSEIIFTSGGTESNNLAIKGVSFQYQGRGNHIITTEIEHASVRETMEQLRKFGFEITYLPVDHAGKVSVTSVEKAIRKETILVSIMHVNNEVGTVQPIKEIGKLLKDYSKILFHVDHIQGIGKVPLDFQECGIDLCSISGHKFHGLKGTGALYIRDGLKISPLLLGGSQELKVRSGTENVAGIVAMAKALRLTMDQYAEKKSSMMQVSDVIRGGLAEIEGITVNSPNIGSAPHIINFSVKGFKGETFVHLLEEKGIYVSTTSACSSKIPQASKTLLAMGIPVEEAKSAIRISLSYDNTIKEAKKAINVISESLNHLGEVLN